PDELSGALGAIRYGQAVLLAVLTGETAPMPYDGIYALSTPKRQFTILINVASTLRQTGPRAPAAGLLRYACGTLAREIFNAPDATVERLFLEDLQKLYPETKGLVREAVVKRWERIVPYAFPGRYQLQPKLRSAAGRVFLAGDYLGSWANMEVAVS